MKPKCSVADCEFFSYRRGFCLAHYGRVKRLGHPDEASPLRPSPGSRNEWLNSNSCHTGDECLNWPFGTLRTAGIGVSIDGKRVGAQRAMCILAHGQPPSSDHEAAHSCGNGHLGCLNPKHLRWATPKENQQERILHGTDNRGAKAPMAKLNETQVLMIREQKGKESSRALASRFGVSRTAIKYIWSGRNWGWLD